VFIPWSGANGEQLRSGGDYGTALSAGCANGDLDTMKNLLATASIRKDQGEQMV
jgi:hypothetical protein